MKCAEREKRTTRWIVVVLVLAPLVVQGSHGCFRLVEVLQRSVYPYMEGQSEASVGSSLLCRAGLLCLLAPPVHCGTSNPSGISAGVVFALACFCAAVCIAEYARSSVNGAIRASALASTRIRLQPDAAELTIAHGSLINNITIRR
jgi:hypothetical protein